MRSKERYAYIVLTCLALVVAFLAVTAALSQVHSNKNKFCHLVTISNNNPPTVITPRSVSMYKGYAEFGRQLGCPK